MSLHVTLSTNKLNSNVVVLYICLSCRDYIGQIIGGVIGFVALIIMVMVLCCYARKQQAKRNAMASTTANTEGVTVSSYF